MTEKKIAVAMTEEQRKGIEQVLEDFMNASYAQAGYLPLHRTEPANFPILRALDLIDESFKGGAK